MDQGEWSAKEAPTCQLSDLLSRYEAQVSPRKRSKSDTFHLRQIARHSIAKLQVSEISSEAIIHFRDYRLKTVAPSTVRKEICLLGQVLNHARSEWGVALKDNPVSGVKKPPASKGRDRRLDEEEMRSLYKALNRCRNPLVRDVFRFAILTGMRRGEILSLDWKHIDLENRTAHLPLTKNGEARTVPLSPQAIAILNERGVSCSEELVFPISANALRLAWERVKSRAKVLDFRFHDLRHEAISRFFEMGLSVPEVALISGHKDAKMLFRYTHLRPNDLAKKLETIGGTAGCVDDCLG
jgi:integrase